MSETPEIGLVDDEPDMLRALSRLLRGEGFGVQTFDSAEAFIESGNTGQFDCLVLDVTMPGLGGLGLQAHLQSAGVRVPIVFLTGTGDIPTSVRAMKAGAVSFLTKPFDTDDLLAAIRDGLEQSARLQADTRQRSTDLACFDQLTPRECEVLRHVISGQLNKQIAYNLGISEQTVKVHRMRVMEKMNASSVVELVRAAERLEIAPVED